MFRWLRRGKSWRRIVWCCPSARPFSAKCLRKCHRIPMPLVSTETKMRKNRKQLPCEQILTYFSKFAVFLNNVSHSALKDLIQFMYCGEVNVKQDALPAFISTAESLQIKGLTDVSINPYTLALYEKRTTYSAVRARNTYKAHTHTHTVEIVCIRAGLTVLSYKTKHATYRACTRDRDGMSMPLLTVYLFRSLCQL